MYFLEHNTDRILWTVLVLAIGVALYVSFKPAANGLLGQTTEKIQDVVGGVNSNKSDSSNTNLSSSGTVDSSSDSDFHYSEPNTADDTISIVGYSGHKENLIIPQYRKIGSVNYKVTSIGDKVFTGNNDIKQVTIPDGVTSIGNYAFFNTLLTSVDLPAGLTSISDWAFTHTKLTSVDIPDSVTSIGNYAFSNTPLASVHLPASLTSIGKAAFADTPLTSVDLPAGLTSIGDRAFYGTKLTSVAFPAGLTHNNQTFDANAIQQVFDSGVTVTFK